MARSEPLNRGSRFTLLAMICLVTAALYFAQPVLVPLALAVLLSFLLSPVIRRLERIGVHRAIAVIVAVALLFGVIGTLGYVVFQQVSTLARNLPAYRENIKSSGRWLGGPDGQPGVLKNIKETKEAIAEAISSSTTQAATESQPATGETTAVAVPAKKIADVPPPVVQTSPPSPERVATVTGASEPGPPVPVTVVPPEPTALESMWNNLGLIVGPLGTAGIVIVFVIFMLLQREDLRDRLIRLLGHGQGQLHVTTQAMDDAATRISRYLTAVAIVNGTYGLAISAGLWGIGQWVGDHPFPSPLLWGLLCALLRFIPYVGPWVAAAFPMIISMAAYSNFYVFGAVVTMFVVVELLSNNIMEPMLYGASTGMSTVAVLVSAVFWTWLWGPIGLVLATPLTVCLVVLGKYVPQLQFLDILLGDEPVLDPPARVYQRLLAMDSEEAEEVVDELAAQLSLEQVYDDVLIPALAMAEEDRHRGRIDEQRHRFIRQSMRAMIDELGDAERLRETRRATAETVARAREIPAAPSPSPAPANATPASQPSAANGSPKEQQPAPAAPAPRPKLPEKCEVNVVCLPAHDEADEIIGLMLGQLLELRNYCAKTVSVTALAGEMLDLIEKDRADIVCISALPPAAVAHSRYLCKRLAARFSEMPLVIGLWTFKGDLKRARDRMSCDDSVHLTATLAQVLQQINETAQHIVVRNQGPKQEPQPQQPKPARV